MKSRKKFMLSLTCPIRHSDASISVKLHIGFPDRKKYKNIFFLENCSIGPTKTIHILIYTDLQNLLCLLYSTNKYILASQIYT